MVGKHPAGLAVSPLGSREAGPSGGSPEPGGVPEEREESPLVAMKAPPQIGMEEYERHQIDHCPFHSWCRAWVAGRGKADPHRQRDGDDPLVPIVSCDYCFMGEKVEDGMFYVRSDLHALGAGVATAPGTCSRARGATGWVTNSRHIADEIAEFCNRQPDEGGDIVVGAVLRGLRQELQERSVFVHSILCFLFIRYSVLVQSTLSVFLCIRYS